ncbi:MAG TPA: DUF1835 domain-containing protein [Pyrinomonadaceae bacterium]|nr:DUF1835 domain-containing protein [Pyrinomonadaceae bacterium]
MIFQVLPGDAYVDNFHETGLEGDVAIFRESLIEGDLAGDSLPDFWRSREQFLSNAYPDAEKSYIDHVVTEIEKFNSAKKGDEVNLWFEFELFCSVNYWFCLYLLKDSEADIYRVAPIVRDASTKWLGLGGLNAKELHKCFEHRIRLNGNDRKLGRHLWLAFRTGDNARLLELSSTASPAFPYLIDAAEAAAEIDTKPRQILNQIITEGGKEFGEIFSKFTKRAGVYGFGDAQVKRILESITH